MICCVREQCTYLESNLCQYQPRIFIQTSILNMYPYSYVYFKKGWMYNIPYSLHSRQGRRHGTQGLHGDSRLQHSHILQPSDWTRSGYQCCLLDRKLSNFPLLIRQGSYWLRNPINVLKKMDNLQCKIAPYSPESCPWQTTRSGVHDIRLWRSL